MTVLQSSTGHFENSFSHTARVNVLESRLHKNKGSRSVESSIAIENKSTCVQPTRLGFGNYRFTPFPSFPAPPGLP